MAVILAVSIPNTTLGGCDEPNILPTSDMIEDHNSIPNNRLLSADPDCGGVNGIQDEQIYECYKGRSKSNSNM